MPTPWSANTRSAYMGRSSNRFVVLCTQTELSRYIRYAIESMQRIRQTQPRLGPFARIVHARARMAYTGYRIRVILSYRSGKR